MTSSRNDSYHVHHYCGTYQYINTRRWHHFIHTISTESSQYKSSRGNIQFLGDIGKDKFHSILDSCMNHYSFWIHLQWIVFREEWLQHVYTNWNSFRRKRQGEETEWFIFHTLLYINFHLWVYLSTFTTFDESNVLTIKPINNLALLTTKMISPHFCGLLRSEVIIGW